MWSHWTSLRSSALRFRSDRSKKSLTENPYWGIISLKMRHLLFLIPVLALLVTFTFGQSASTDPEKIEAERRPQPEKLVELVNSADRIAVFASVAGDDEKMIFETTKADDLIAFRQALRLVIPEGWSMSICPTPRVILYRDGKEVAWIGNVYGEEVRTSVWGANANLEDPEKWLKWFDDRGMPEVRRERDEAIAYAKKTEADRARFYAAMPRGIEKQFEKQLGLFGLPSQRFVKSFLPILEKEYPDRNERILVLLRWYGSGAGPWSGAPAYEDIAGSILLEFPTEQIVKAVTSKDQSGVEMEGAARFFAGWDFHRTRPEDISLLPKKLKKEFLERSLKSTDEDKVARAKKAFVSN